MKFSVKFAVLAAVTTFVAASPSPQLGGLPSLPVCLTGTLTSSLPAGVNLVSCSAGQTCQDPSVLLASVPILGVILGGIISTLPAGVGLCA